MVRTQLRVFASPDAIGDELAERLLERIEHARIAGPRFVLGCPTATVIHECAIREIWSDTEAARPLDAR